MTDRIFISYRREDSFWQSLSICQVLRNHGEPASVFMDTDTIDPGEDWPDRIQHALAEADTVLVVIGDCGRWLGVDKHGKRRIDRTTDWVRREVDYALHNNKMVIPVMVGPDQEMPPKEALPPKLRLLIPKQQFSIRHQTWGSDARMLLDTVLPIESRHAFPPIGRTTPEPSTEELAARCESVLRDYNAKCMHDWGQFQPSRFIEPHLAIRQPVPEQEEVLDRSQGRQQQHRSLLTDEEKQQPAAELAVEQYRRLFSEKQPGQQTARLCVTEDAGAGKSIFTHHLRQVLATPAGQTVFFDGHAGLVVRWEGRERTWPFDLRQALAEAVSDCCGPHDVDAGQVVEHALQHQRVCLILDALDQVTDDFTPAGIRIERGELLNRIFRFLNSDDGRQCHVVITGRSYAVTREADGARFPDKVWTFATLEGFDRQQQERYLDDFLPARKIHDLIPSYDEVSELLEVPVILSLIAEIAEADQRPNPHVRLEQFQTRGDVYRESHEKLADRAEKTLIPVNVSARARWDAILAAAAFVMMCHPIQRRNYAVSGVNDVIHLRDIVAAAAAARRSSTQHLNPAVCDADWDDLASFSQLTNHASVENCSNLGVSWKHRGWMEYFTGLYLARYASAEAIAQAAKFSNDPDWQWAWRFTIEMRDNVVDAETRTTALASLFHRPADGRRPNELIYRAWEVMEATEEGRQARQRFQGEFQGLQAKGHPVAAQIESGFRPCPPDADCDNLTFDMGSPETDAEAFSDEKPQIPMTVKPFEMANAPVTNEQYGLYDPAHQHDSEFAERLEEYSPEENCPVIFITWYDAWCFAKWCGWRLPTEAEWEYACRAGTTTRYWWADDFDESKCNMNGSNTTPASEQHANPWGFMEMSGNVYEWCEDTWRASYEEDPEIDANSRVLRGGSFNFNYPQILRSAYRNLITPDFRFNNLGFRISRTP